MLFSEDRSALRRMYAEAWRRAREGLPLEPLQVQIVQLVEAHPEYHALLEDAASIDRDWTPEQGDTNPYLHLSLHLAIREQCSTDRPAGIAALRERLAERLGDPHGAEHAMIEVLGAALWEAQRAGRAPDEAAYLERLRQLLT
ncbi:MAG: DUF1841 family protein [Pseudomonadota bacterium]